MSQDHPDHPDPPDPPDHRDKPSAKPRLPVLNYLEAGFEAGQKLVAVRVFANGFEANLAAEKLRAEGIPCTLGNENAATMMGSLNAMLDGGIKLLVQTQDKERADQLLPQHRQPRPERCPACKSRHTREVPWRTWARSRFCQSGI